MLNPRWLFYALLTDVLMLSVSLEKKYHPTVKAAPANKIFKKSNVVKNAK